MSTKRSAEMKVEPINTVALQDHNLERLASNAADTLKLIAREGADRIAGSLLQWWTESYLPHVMWVSVEYPGHVEVRLDSGGLWLIGTSNGDWGADYHESAQDAIDGKRAANVTRLCDLNVPLSVVVGEVLQMLAAEDPKTLTRTP